MKKAMIRVTALSLVLAAAYSAATAASETATGNWIALFDGKTLDGWKAGENGGTFKVQDGMIVAHGLRSHLFYVGPVANHTFKNFELKAEVKTAPRANSGIYFHTAFQQAGWPKKGYEVQINNTYPGTGRYRELKKTGSLYSVRNLFKSPVKDNEWFTMDVKVEGRRIRIKLNGQLVVDYIEPDDPVRSPEHAGSVLSQGTFALQGHDPQSKVCFRNVLVKVLPDAPKPKDDRPPSEIEYQKEISALGAADFPLIDLHTHLKGGLTIDQALAQSRHAGITYGIAQNCGLDFPVKNDEALKAYVKSLQGKPVFIAMQAEGREWVKLFSRKAIAQCDYVFTDAMTFTDDQGRRIHLWKPEEVHISDTQQFMEMLVGKIVTILNNEPINIYVNPTFLPAVIAGQYDQLWTRERMVRVIRAAVANHVAIEINSRYRIPSPAFIKLAKSMGCKFTFGTNNPGPELGTCEYAREMVKECGLTKDDMWIPEKNE
jgi:3-keto-disaccharide hydrolase